SVWRAGWTHGLEAGAEPHLAHTPAQPAFSLNRLGPWLSASWVNTNTTPGSRWRRSSASTLERPRQQPANEVAPEEDVNQDGGDGGQNRAGHGQVPRHGLAPGQLGQSERTGVRRREGQRTRPQGLVA